MAGRGRPDYYETDDDEDSPIGQWNMDNDGVREVMDLENEVENEVQFDGYDSNGEEEKQGECDDKNNEEEEEEEEQLDEQERLKRTIIVWDCPCHECFK